MASYSSTSLSHPLFLLFVLLTAFLCSSIIIAEEQVQGISHPANPYPTPPSHAPAPSPYHHHHHHNHTRHVISPAPAHSPYSAHPPKPATPPTQMPSKPPSGPPYAKAPVAHPPSHAPAPAHAPYVMPPRKLVAVEGVVYCKNCSYSGVDTLVGASPLSGARVQLRCRNTKYLIKKTSTTDHNGYFLLEAPPLITTYGAHKCRVFLIDTPKNGSGGPCSHPTDLNGGVTGAFLFLNKTSAPHPANKTSFALFNVGPLAYEPSTCHKH